MKCEVCGAFNTRLRLMNGKGVCQDCRRGEGRMQVNKVEGGMPAIHTFKPRVMEHLGPFPILIETKRQLEDECKRRHLRSPVVWDETDSIDHGDAIYKEEYGER